jgi:TonB family protein
MKPIPTMTMKAITGMLVGLVCLSFSGGCATSTPHTSTQPVATFQARPMYPFEMRRAGISGQATVGFVIDTQGIPRELYIVSSSNKAFEKVSLMCVSKWQFKPGTVDGIPVAVRMQVPVIFDINAN